MDTRGFTGFVWLGALVIGPLMGWWLALRRYRRPRLQWSVRAPVRLPGPDAPAQWLNALDILHLGPEPASGGIGETTIFVAFDAPTRILATEVSQADHGAVLRSNRVPRFLPHEVTEKGIRLALPPQWPRGRLTTVAISTEGPHVLPQAANLDAGVPLVRRRRGITGEGLWMELQNNWTVMALFAFIAMNLVVGGGPASGQPEGSGFVRAMAVLVGCYLGFLVGYRVVLARELRPLLKARLPDPASTSPPHLAAAARPAAG